MSIVKMKKLQLAGLSNERDALLQKLQKLGCVEIRVTEAPEGYLSPVIGGPDDQEPEILRRKQKDAENAIRYLKKYAYEKTGLFQEKELISETDFFADIREEAMRAVGSVLEAVQSLGEHQDRQSTLNAQRDSLLLWQDLPVPLETRETRSSRVFIGSIAAPKTAEELEEAISAAGLEGGVRGAGRNRERQGILAVCLKSEEEAFSEILREFGYEAAPTASLRGTAGENIARLEEQAELAGRDEEETLAYLKECGKHRRLIKLWYDRLTLEIDAAEAQQKLLNTERAFALTGWVDEPHVSALETLLGDYCCAWELSDPTAEDKVPIRLQNNAVTRPLNMVTEMYSLPDYRNVDPNPLIAPFFCIFFGMMFNDLGYGLVFILLSLIVQKKFRLQRGMKNMMQLMLECGVTTAIFGILTGSFHGSVGAVLQLVLNGRNDHVQVVLGIGLVVVPVHVSAVPGSQGHFSGLGLLRGLGRFRRLGGFGGLGFLGLGGFGGRLRAGDSHAEDHDQSQQDRYCLFHHRSSYFYFSPIEKSSSYHSIRNGSSSSCLSSTQESWQKRGESMTIK